MKIEYKDTSIYFEDVGVGDTVVLLHGFLENSSMWKELVPQLSKSNRLISVDLLGHGDTGCLGYIHTMEMMADSVEAVLSHLKINKALFVGHSMGGYVALALTELYPQRVKGFCLMNSSAIADSEEKQLNRNRAIASVKQNHRAFISMSISNLFAPENRGRLSDEIEEVKKEALKIPLQGVIAALEGMKIRKQRTDLLHNMSIKKMMIIGRKDPVLEYDALMNQVSNTSVKVIEFPYGHMSHIENKEELTYNLLHFIEK